MTVYVVFGGMFATSWVQIVKTVVLMSGTFLLALIVFSRFGWSIQELISNVKPGTPLGEQFFSQVIYMITHWKVYPYISR